MTPLLLAALVVGLLGSLHCAGMCGPLAVVVGCGGPAQGASKRLSLFVAGKTLTYVTLGASAGIIGAAVDPTGLRGDAFALLALFAGVLMVYFGVTVLWRRLSKHRSKPSPTERLLQRVLQSRNPSMPIAAGMLVGLLPCGLVYGMLAQSLATGGVLEGALVMVAFGLGTAPSLFATGWLSTRVSGRSRRWGERLAAVSVILMGLIAVGRGALGLTAEPGEAPACHDASIEAPREVTPDADSSTKPCLHHNASD